ncbi:glycosyltransferase family 4 protein [Pseudanabaena sp. FACHB-1277]|uniref:Glycosyltransferase family 4 protein n=1 Tax=Pseudanabaena cinerea FACHB-1277 TaxID=2949581 RepID=A0A926UQ18_9CYAN|nr:glycosyltransferase [Pseudanabaena cinerea]MBD2148907.1 glycosyltransferase family 4 protein [Pseudanabaena cinerea FACHB-1277]
MKKHLLFILPYLNQGGTEKQALSLIEGLGDRYKISLLAPDGKGAPQFRCLPILQREFTRLEFNFFKGLPELIKGIKEINQEQAIDLIHVHAAHELMIPVKLVLKKVPIIFTVHGYHGDSAKISYQLSCWFSNLFASQVISVCEAEYLILKELGLNAKKLNLIYNGVKEPSLDANKSIEFAQRFNLDPAKQIILGTAARLNEAKGLTYLLKAFAALTPSPNGGGEQELRLVIAGTGDLETSLKQEAQDLGISDRVIFAGYIDDLPNLMQLFDIFTLPSLQEPFGLVCAEAMSQRKPVVVTNVGGLAEQVSDHETGFIVPPRDPEQLALKLRQLIDNAELRDRFAQNGYDRYCQIFSSETMLNKTATLYEQYLLTVH